MKWDEGGAVEELAAYLGRIAAVVDEVVVVDGSPAERFAEHEAHFGNPARHVRPDLDLSFENGKVNGVITGVRLSRNELVVIADDDVRYAPDELDRIIDMLGRSDLVRPQNYFRPWVWHALWDASRSLINRVLTGDREFPRGDFPGTLAVRRSTFVSAGAYDGDCLFENLELMRTILAAGGKILSPLDLYVARAPPAARHFLSQRVRQAYDDRAMPLRAMVFLAILPLVVVMEGRSRRRFLILVAATSVLLAEMGRRSAGARRHFPLAATLFAPAWVFERALCSWLALFTYTRGGPKYGGRRVLRSANPTNRLRRRILGGETGAVADRSVVSRPAVRRWPLRAVRAGPRPPRTRESPPR